MPLILGTNSIKDTGYDVANSLRFNSGSSDSLARTPSSASNRKTFTISYWVKRANLGAEQNVCGVHENSSHNFNAMFNTDDNIEMKFKIGGANNKLQTNAKFRDTSAWYHIVLAVDTTDGTASNRFKLYVNGTQTTSFDTASYPNQNVNTEVNLDGLSFKVGRSGDDSDTDYLDGYLAEFCLIDGSQLGADSFGEFDEDSGIWKPIDVSGLSFGTNGFYLPFENSGALGQDDSGNGNNFTVNNLTSIDQTTDTCTNNFATMNPLDNYYANSTFSEGNLKLVQGSSTYAHNLSTIAVTNGKWYAEAKLTTDSDHALVGITDRSPVQALNDILGSNSFDYSIKKSNGDLFNNRGTNPSNDATDYAGAYAQNDIIGIALDLDNNKLYFSKGGQWSNGSGAWDSTTFNSSTGAITITAPASTNNGHYFFASGDYGGAVVNWEWNFGNPPFTISSGNSDGNGYGNFEYAVPSGYYALNTKNLAEYG